MRTYQPGPGLAPVVVEEQIVGRNELQAINTIDELIQDSKSKENTHRIIDGTFDQYAKVSTNSGMKLDSQGASYMAPALAENLGLARWVLDFNVQSQINHFDFNTSNCLEKHEARKMFMVALRLKRLQLAAWPANDDEVPYVKGLEDAGYNVVVVAGTGDNFFFGFHCFLDVGGNISCKPHKDI